MSIHKEKIEEKICAKYKEIEKLLEGYVTPALVHALRMLAKTYNGGSINPEISDFIVWVATYLAPEERKKLGREFPIILEKRQTEMMKFPDIDILLSRIREINIIPIMIGHGDGITVYEGKEGVKMQMKSIDMLDVFNIAIGGGKQSAFAFSKDKKFYMFTQYKCESCDDLHYKLYVVDEDGSSKSKNRIKSLQLQYKNMLILS